MEALLRCLNQSQFFICGYCTPALCSLGRSNSWVSGASYNDLLKRKDIFDHLIIPVTVKSVSEDTFKWELQKHGKRSKLSSQPPLTWQNLTDYADAYSTLPHPISHKKYVRCLGHSMTKLPHLHRWASIEPAWAIFPFRVVIYGKTRCSHCWCQLPAST